jgi:hypothetical protein
MKNFYVVFTLFMVGCGNSAHLPPEKLSAFVIDEEHGLKKTAVLNGINTEVTYRPVDLLIYQEIDKQVVDAKEIENLRKKYNQYIYFVLSLLNDSKEALHQAGGSQYSDLVQTLSFRMNKYVTLTTAASDTIPVGDFMLNRTYGMSSSTDLLFVFNKEKTIGQDWIQFNLNEFGLGVGNQRFRFAMDDIEKVPEVNFTVKN